MPRITLFLIILLPLISSGQFNQKKIYNIKKIDKSPKIDGRLNDDVWQDLTKATGFTQISPRNGEKERANQKTARVSQWSAEERFEHTKNVVPKMKEMGLGVYAKEVSVLETIVDNYVYKGVECTYTLPLKGAKKDIVIKLLLDRSVLPMIKLSSSSA